MSQPWLSVVVPMYNEERNAPEAVRRVSAFCDLKGQPWEMIVVDDGSTDRTREVLDGIEKQRNDPRLRVFHSVGKNHGKGYAARTGILAASGRYVLLADADMSSPIKEVDKLIAAIEKGADVAIGSRALRAPGTDVQQSFKRSLSGRIFNIFVQTLVLPGIYDSQCGFKCFTKDAAKRLFSRQKLDGFSFDVEVLYLARQMGMKIAEVPVMWSQGQDTRVSLIRDPLRMVQDLGKIKKLHV